ncbi:hypothetical protein FDE98_17850 [Clostridium sporogenes]|uniref:Uncharacterized protein n=1 Tax=Clostridium sporogenes TaxID=1509 RepID=A0A7X5PD02_CLOSG|nr:hypothetical protein [Clostridium sporogenes]AJD29224.1 hypothetical protein T258_4043 [Clostridium botulinum Prevot_594]NFL98404.1 hypothetical protein [Clostridium botulinum]NFP56270.1 hypothetical protein [Clostridium botulinum]NFQ18226.1 hypothetical protein [Clostridium sporogenes]NFQ22177.1 hypothetical protein [Clostridium sporogenes]
MELDELLKNIKKNIDDSKTTKRLMVVNLASDLKEGIISNVKLSNISELCRTDIEKLIDSYFVE